MKRKSLKAVAAVASGGSGSRGKGNRNRERAGECLDERVEAEWWKKTR